MFTIEFEEPSRKKCDCCDKVNTNLTRFVYQNGDAFAVYYLQFTEGHPQKIATGIISIVTGEGMMRRKTETPSRLKFGMMEATFKSDLLTKKIPHGNMTYLEIS